MAIATDREEKKKKSDEVNEEDGRSESTGQVGPMECQRFRVTTQMVRDARLVISTLHAREEANRRRSLALDYVRSARKPSKPSRFLLKALEMVVRMLF